MPWGRLDDSLYDHPKLDLIPAESRLAAIGLWARAISWCNRFLTDGQVPRSRVERLDGSTELASQLVAAGLFDETPHGYAVHDFLEFNDSRDDVIARRGRDAQRKAQWRKARRSDDPDTASERSHSGTSNVAQGDVPPGVTAGHANNNGKMSHRDSRARARSANPDPSRPVPSESSLSRGSRAGEREDIAALHARGWKRVTKAQRAILDEVAARHDVTGHAFAAEAISTAAPDADPLEAVMTADRLWQDAQRKRVEREELEWTAAKDQERREAKDRLGTIDAELEAWR